MKKKIIYALLLVSLAFNLAFVYKIVQVRYTLDNPKREIAKKRLPKMRFSDEEREEFSKYKRDFDEDKYEFFDMIWDDDISEQELYDELEEMSEKAKYFEFFLGEYMIQNRENMHNMQDFDKRKMPMHRANQNRRNNQNNN